jgi:UDP-N-acetylglucosamine--N-acetylmuramyl-(pentapeptide) pyrophosphoryl-undecaprenol N-acetylglucosamine transferase
MSGTNRLLLLAGGGTGGHVFPAVALAEEWTARGGRVVFVGSPQGLEARVVPELGYDFVAVDSRRLKNAGTVERLRSLAGMPSALWTARRLVRRLRPDVVLGVGGYVSGPVVLAAALSGWPCAVAEQNARPGLTNRILGRFVRRVYTAFPEAAERLPAGKVRELGNPVRNEIRLLAESAPEAGRDHHVLVLGGSQGARALNQKLPPAVAALAARHPLHVRHQAGRGNGDAVREAYAEAGVTDVLVEEFIDDVAGAMADADLVVARAGATTVAELACVGRPALFVPFPYAADDHQAANARALVQAGAARVVVQSELDPAALAADLSALARDRAALGAMGDAARTVGRPDAAQDVVDTLETLAGDKR